MTAILSQMKTFLSNSKAYDYVFYFFPQAALDLGMSHPVAVEVEQKKSKSQNLFKPTRPGVFWPSRAWGGGVDSIPPLNFWVLRPKNNQ